MVITNFRLLLPSENSNYLALYGIFCLNFEGFATGQFDRRNTSAMQVLDTLEQF